MGFPDLNSYSLPLLLLVAAGLVFAGLLVARYLRDRHPSDLLLALLLVVQAHSCISYTIGFLGWYDAFPTTKINYYLLSEAFILGPLAYLYIVCLTEPGRGLRRRDLWHAAPALLYAVYEVGVLIHDAAQPGFADTQNGVWLESIHYPFVAPFHDVLGSLSQILYLGFGIQRYIAYRSRVAAYYSDTYALELRWLRNFLIVYSALFAVALVLDIVNDQIVPLHYTQNWWGQLATAASVLYLGIEGFRTDSPGRHDRSFSPPTTDAFVDAGLDETLESLKSDIERFMAAERPFLQADLTLGDLARQLDLPTTQLSHLINAGFGKNFSDFVNGYRVEAVKRLLQEGAGDRLTLLGVALECGFNSKATFNRTFKKVTSQTPSEYLETLSRPGSS